MYKMSKSPCFTGFFYGVPGMALIQSEPNRPQIVTAKCSEQQVSINDDLGEGSGVAIPLYVRTKK